MRIAIVTHCIARGDGQGRANLEIVRHMQRKGATIHAICHMIDPELEKSGIHVHKIDIPSALQKVSLFKEMFFTRQANRKLREIQGEYDLLHSYGFVVPAAADINTSQFVHSAWLRSPNHPARTQRNLYGLYQFLYTVLNGRWEKKAYLQSRHVVAASSTVSRELQEIIGVSPERLSIIHNGADIEEFFPRDFPDTELAGRRRELGLPEAGRLALFAGDIRTPRKNLDSVLKAVAAVADWKLVVVGRVQGSPFPEMARKLGISDRVFFLDFRRDVAQIMRACDLFLFPSRYEACALVLAEAAASGLPIVSSVATGGAEIVDPDARILIDDPDSLDDLIAALRCVSDPQRLQAMREQAERSAASMSWTRIGEQYESLYKSLT